MNVNTDDPSAPLRARLERGQRRVHAAAPGSPEWDAAMANTDALARQLDALRPLPSVLGEHIVSRLGPMILDDGCVVRGTIAASGPNGEALRLAISAIPERIRSRNEVVQELEATVHRAKFVFEFEAGELEVSFYAWEPEGQQPTADEPD